MSIRSNGLEARAWSVIAARWVGPRRLGALIVLLGTLAPPLAAQTLFFDDFNRPNSPVVGNGWLEAELPPDQARIRSNRLRFDVNNQPASPLILHTFSSVGSGQIRWSFQFRWRRSGGDQLYELWMQLGNSALMVDPNVSDNAGVAVNLKWAGPNNGMTNHEGFGYVQGATTTEVTVIGGGNNRIEIVADLGTNTFDIIVNGTPQATGVAFDNNVSIDAIRLYADEMNAGSFSGRRFDDMLVETFSPPATTLTRYVWSADNPTFTSQGDDTPLTFQLSTVYILALQVSMTTSVPTGDWFLQVREDGAGPWLDVSNLAGGSSPVWQTFNTHTYARSNGETVPVAEFGVVGTPAGFTAVDGEFSHDNNGLRDGYGGSNIFTELQYAIRAEPSAAGHVYEFRVTYEGNPLSGGYDILALANPTAPQMSVAKSVVPPGTSPPLTNLTYTVSFANVGSADAVNVTIVDSLAAEVWFGVGSVVNNLPPGITATVEYSDDNATTWIYAPVSGACAAPAGYDGCVTHIRWTLQSDLSFVAPDNAGDVQFIAQIQ